jgi:hypothetical protein
MYGGIETQSRSREKKRRGVFRTKFRVGFQVAVYCCANLLNNYLIYGADRYKTEGFEYEKHDS